MYSCLLNAMNERKISNKDIAQLLCVHRNTITNKLNGSTPLFLEEAKAIHKAYFADMDFLELFVFSHKGGDRNEFKKE